MRPTTAPPASTSKFFARSADEAATKGLLLHGGFGDFFPTLRLGGPRIRWFRFVLPAREPLQATRSYDGYGQASRLPLSSRDRPESLRGIGQGPSSRTPRAPRDVPRFHHLRWWPASNSLRGREHAVCDVYLIVEGTKLVPVLL